MAANAGAPNVVWLSTLGTLEQFDPNSGQPWSQWMARFNLYCETNHIAPEPMQDGMYFQDTNQRRTFFLTAIGPRAYGVVHAIALPGSPETFPIPTLHGVLQQHFENPGLVEANRYSFHTRMQKPDESVFSYVLALQEQAQYCNFGEHLESALGSQLILGIKHQDVKLKLLNRPGITWQDAKTLAIQDDLIKEQAKKMAAQVSVHSVQVGHKTHSENKKHPQAQPQQESAKETEGEKKFSPCWYCTKLHRGSTCPARQWVCNKCNQKGHAAAACEELAKRFPKKAESKHPVHHLEAEGTVDDLVEQLLQL